MELLQRSGSDAMKVLVTEGDAGAAARLLHALEGAGHVVLTCQDPRLGRAPCVGLAGLPCPLDTSRPDLVVSVRRRPHPKLQLDEIGIVCGLRDRIPLVLAGNTVMHPLADRAMAAIPTLDPARVLAGISALAGIEREVATNGEP